jgi:hypothetical protein
LLEQSGELPREESTRDGMPTPCQSRTGPISNWLALTSLTGSAYDPALTPPESEPTIEEQGSYRGAGKVKLDTKNESLLHLPQLLARRRRAKPTRTD